MAQVTVLDQSYPHNQTMSMKHQSQTERDTKPPVANMAGGFRFAIPNHQPVSLTTEAGKGAIENGRNRVEIMLITKTMPQRPHCVLTHNRIRPVRCRSWPPECMKYPYIWFPKGQAKLGRRPVPVNSTMLNSILTYSGEKGGEGGINPTRQAISTSVGRGAVGKNTDVPFLA